MCPERRSAMINPWSVEASIDKDQEKGRSRCFTVAPPPTCRFTIAVCTSNWRNQENGTRCSATPTCQRNNRPRSSDSPPACPQRQPDATLLHKTESTTQRGGQQRTAPSSPRLFVSSSPRLNPYGKIPFTRLTPSMLNTAALAYHLIRHRPASFVSRSPTSVTCNSLFCNPITPSIPNRTA